MSSSSFYPNPWSIQIESTEGCNRRCRFCGIHSLYREKADMTYKFMTVETADLISQDLDEWLPKIRIEFALQGEPLLNPNITKILEKFRNNFPKCQLMMTSNTDMLRKGKNFDTKKLMKLFTSGLNIFVADYYGEKFDPTYQEFYSAFELMSKEIGVPLFDFYKDKPTVWGYENERHQKIVTIDNTAERDMLRTMNNQAGNTNPDFFQDISFKNRISLRMNKRCPLPFREMVIKHDGSVMMCCMDWQRENIVGKFPEQSFEEIWNSMQLNRIRKILYNKRRDLIVPCVRCDYMGLKSGLIVEPDKLMDMEPTNENLLQISKDLRKEQLENQEKYHTNRYSKKPFMYVE